MKIKLNSRLLIYILSVTVAIFIVNFGYIGLKMKPIMQSNVEKMADAHAGKYANLVRSYLTEEMKISRTMADNFETMKALSGEEKLKKSQALQEKLFSKHPYYRSIWMSWEIQFLNPDWKKNYGRIRIDVHSNFGKNVIKLDSLNTYGDDIGSLYLTLKTNKNDVLTDPYFDDYDGVNQMVASVSSPVIIDGRFAGLAGIDIPLSRFKEIISKAESIYGSNIFLVSSDGTFVGNQEAKLVGSSIEDVFEGSDIDIMSKIKKGKAFNLNFDYIDKGNCYISFYPFAINGTDAPWMVGVEVPREAIVKESNSAFSSSLIVGVIGFLVISLVIFIISRSITGPLTHITSTLQLLSRGEINKVKKLNFKSKDEIGDIAESTNTLVDGLSNTALFAKEIGQGNLDAHFENVSDNDILGNALLDMRASLKKAKEDEEIRREKEEEQKWATAGYAKFGELLRNNTDNMEDFTYSVISNLIKYTGSNQGALFLLDDEDEQDASLVMSSCYAYERKKYVDKRIEIGENLVGQCYLESQTIFMTDVPESYVNITSGLGTANPRSIILVPLKFNDQVFGVIEMASFNIYQNFQIEFIEKVGESIASTISTVKVNIRTVKLLEESKLKSEELAAQEEEMRQNMEELQTTQEESARRELEMNGILNALNASYLVAELDLDGNIISINDNAVELMQMSHESIEGRNIRDFHSKDEAEEFENIWQRVIDGDIAKRQRIITRANNSILITESYTPIYDEMDQLFKVLNIGIEVDKE